MLYAVRSNKHLKISDSERGAYLDMGYDIAEIDEDGKQTIVEVAPSKMITHAKHREVVAALEKKVDALEKENAELKELIESVNEPAAKKGKEGGK